MPDPARLRSIQEILRHRRGAAFVGRGGQLALFRENFALPVEDSRKAFIFNVHGEGGVGKSTLLERWRQIARELGAAEALVDEHVFGTPEAMSALVDQIGRPGDTKEFRARYSDFQKYRERLESDPQAPRELWSHVVRTGVKVGLHATKAIPGAAPVVELVDGEAAADAADRVRQFLVGKVRDSRDAHLLLAPTEELSPLFVAALSKVAAEQPVALFFDTFEQTGSFLEDWLLGLIQGDYGDLSPAVVTVIAGRLPLDANRWSGCLALVAAVPLNPFIDAEARQFLAGQGVTDPGTVDTIIALSGGLPLLADMLAKSHPSDAGAVGDPADTAVERFLKWVPDAPHRQAALAGALPRAIDEDLLRAATADEDVAALFTWLTGQAFVRRHAGGYRYHEVVRGPMLRSQRQRSPQRWREGHARLAAVYRERRELVDSAPRWTNDAWLGNHLEATYHELCGRTISLDAALQDAADAVIAGIAVARRWAETIAEAGRDGDHADAREIGSELLQAATVGDRDGDRLLTTVIDLGRHDAPGRAELLVERARLRFLADRDEDAVSDCAEAIRLDPDLASAYTLRATAERYLGRREEALADLNRAVDLDPDYAWAITERGKMHRAMKRYEDALRDFDRAIELQPDEASLVTERGETYHLMKRYDDALADFGRAIDMEPRTSWVRTERGVAYRLTKRYDDALTDINHALDLNPGDDWAIAQRGETYRAMGRFDDALADLDRAIELDPREATYFVFRGVLQQDRGNPADASADLRRAAELADDLEWRYADGLVVFSDQQDV